MLLRILEEYCRSMKAHEAFPQWRRSKYMLERQVVRDQEVIVFSHPEISVKDYSGLTTVIQGHNGTGYTTQTGASYHCHGHTVLNYFSILYIQFRCSKDAQWIWNNILHTIKIRLSEGTLCRMEWLLVRSSRGWWNKEFSRHWRNLLWRLCPVHGGISSGQQNS